MAAEVKKEIQLEIAHVLFTDIVAYSKVPINQQRAVVERLSEIVRGTDEFQAAETAGCLIKIPTGDGITLVFYHSPEAPVECALEISRALKKYPELQLRMGIHSGPVSGVIDATGKPNVAGAGINIAQRVMDCGDAGHILLSKHVAEDLEKSIAVLTFENRSRDPDNAYFADGIQDEILTRLSKVADLKVISRIS